MTDELPLESSTVLPIFPTFVWKNQLTKEVYERINRAIIVKLGETIVHVPTLRVGSHWQSVQTLHELDEFSELISCVNAATRRILKFLNIGYNAFEVTACWLNVSAQRAGHRTHTHPNNFLSGVYYAKTQKGADTINFHDPRTQTFVLRPPVTKLTAQNADQVVVQVRDGTLLMFPAWLPHSVDPNASDGERISVSSNVIFSSFTERLTKPLWSGGEPH